MCKEGFNLGIIENGLRPVATPNPQARTSGPTVGSKAPSLAFRIAAAASTTARVSGDTVNGVPS